LYNISILKSKKLFIHNVKTILFPAGFSEIIGCFLALHFTLKHNKWKWQCAGVFNILAGILGCMGWIFTNADSSKLILITS